MLYGTFWSTQAWARRMISARVVAGGAATARRDVGGSPNGPATWPCGEFAVCGLLSVRGAAATADETAPPPSTLPTAASSTAARRAPRAWIVAPRPDRTASCRARTRAVQPPQAQDSSGSTSLNSISTGDLPFLGEWDSPFTEVAARTS
ncbi:hypothetical protein GCM10010195_28790 [Kitasatospora griseola]|nr:hypothetical protein GCM10010195_28790 [Kitasatospora griseola]